MSARNSCFLNVISLTPNHSSAFTKKIASLLWAQLLPPTAKNEFTVGDSSFHFFHVDGVLEHTDSTGLQQVCRAGSGLRVRVKGLVKQRQGRYWGWQTRWGQKDRKENIRQETDTSMLFATAVSQARVAARAFIRDVSVAL